MTILTKHTIAIKKTPLIPENNRENEIIDIHSAPPGWKPKKRMSVALMCMTITALAVAITGLTSGLMLYRQYLRSTVVHRFQGFCTIPIGHRKSDTFQIIPTEEPNYRVMPLRWSLGTDSDAAADAEGTDEDMQVISTLDDGVSDDFVNSLREELDIGDAVEKIAVIENGRRINFIHDFNSNITGIVDGGRCFTMELDPSVSLPPAVFALGLSTGGQFDVTRVRSTLRAVLPALHQFARLARDIIDTCQDKPIYQLRKEDAVIIRKRSVDEPPHDYIQFAGKHVQEIEINNLAEVLQYEQNNSIDNKNSTA